MEGKFFYLKSKDNGEVLQIANAFENGRVFLGSRKHDLNELWYQDKINNVIRTRRDETLCLTVNDDQVVVSRFHTASEHQLWKISGDRIVRTDQTGKDEKGLLTIVSDGDNHRHWEVVHVAPTYFFMQTCMTDEKKPDEHLIVDVSGGDDDAGAKIILYTKHVEENTPNQLWWEDKYGFIHSRINGFVLDLKSKKDQFVINPYADNVESQQWVKAGDVIVNRNKPTEVMDVKGGKNKKGSVMVPWEYHGADNQHWFFVYLPDTFL